MKKVFLGGTCNESDWRNKLINMLKINYFNPVVDDWNEESYQNELKEREMCDWCLYVITPKMTGVYSIAEVIDDSNKRPDKTIFVILDNDIDREFSNSMSRSLNAVAKMVKLNGGKTFQNLETLAEYLNNN